MLLPVLLQASYVIKNDLGIGIMSVEKINMIGEELEKKTGIKAKVIATKDAIKRGESLYDYAKQFQTQTKQEIFFILAPVEKRIGVISFNKTLEQNVDKDEVYEFALGVIAAKDKNSMQDKYDLGAVQAYSELADQLAKAQNVQLNNTIPDTTNSTINFLRVIVYSGTLLLFYGMFVKPYLLRRQEKRNEQDKSNG